jgi:hypothetical protein
VTVSVAWTVALPSDTVTVTEASEVTGDVVTSKLTLDAPSGTVTVAGTLAAGLSLLTVSISPPTGAAPSSETVAVVVVPPVTEA